MIVAKTALIPSFQRLILPDFLQRKTKYTNPAGSKQDPAGQFYIILYSRQDSFLALYSLYISSVASRSLATDTDLFLGKQK